MPMTTVDPARVLAMGCSRLVGREAARPPRFLGSPCMRAELYDPGGASVPRSTVNPPCAEVMPSALNTASASTTQAFRGSITRPTHPLSTLRSHGRPCVSYGHARLALNQATQPGRTGFPPVGYSLKFWALPLLSSQACPGARSTPSQGAGGTSWPGHHVHDLNHGGAPMSGDIIPVPPENHSEFNVEYPRCYDGTGGWNVAGPYWPYSE